MHCQVAVWLAQLVTDDASKYSIPHYHTCSVITFLSFILQRDVVLNVDRSASSARQASSNVCSCCYGCISLSLQSNDRAQIAVCTECHSYVVAPKAKARMYRDCDWCMHGAGLLGFRGSAIDESWSCSRRSPLARQAPSWESRKSKPASPALTRQVDSMCPPCLHPHSSFSKLTTYLLSKLHSFWTPNLLTERDGNDVQAARQCTAG